MENLKGKEYYIKNLPSGAPLFHSPFWLNAVCGNNWDVVMVIKQDKIVASMPYSFIENKKPLLIRLPALTQFLGPYLVKRDEPNYKNVSRISDEIELITLLLEQLPDFKSYHQQWNYNYQNWLPFYWKGFSQTTKYSYVLDNANIDSIWSGFKNDVRTEINKGEKLLKIVESKNLEKFYSLFSNTFIKKGLKPPFTYDFIGRVISAAEENKSGKIMFAEDLGGNTVAALFIAWDNHTVYYLLGGFDNDYKYNGAMGYLLWHAIQFAAQSNRKFDFEGSMIKDIEYFFRKFGGVPKPYFAISKDTKTRTDLVLDSLRLIKKALLLK
jgi:hypothetical protein